jgi:thiol:disulfide interchange protein DsbD
MACKNHFTVVGMGFLSALIVSPCITPPLVGALSYITTTGNISLGTSALFFMGLGLGLPLLFIGALGNTLLPKVGRWMNTIKFLMGIVLLGVAFFMIQRLIPHYITILWGSFVCISFIILLYRIDFETPWRQRMFQTLCFIGIVGGGFAILHHVFNHSISQQKSYITVTNSEQLEYYLKLAKEEHKPVMVDFYADWCPDCQLMEAQVFNQPKVTRLLKKFMWLKVDMTKDSQKIWDLQEQYNVSGPPTFLFYAADGSSLKQFNFVGTKSEASVVHILTKIFE